MRRPNRTLKKSWMRPARTDFLDDDGLAVARIHWRCRAPTGMVEVWPARIIGARLERL